MIGELRFYFRLFSIIWLCSLSGIHGNDCLQQQQQPQAFGFPFSSFRSSLTCLHLLDFAVFSYASLPHCWLFLSRMYFTSHCFYFEVALLASSVLFLTCAKSLFISCCFITWAISCNSPFSFTFFEIIKMLIWTFLFHGDNASEVHLSFLLLAMLIPPMFL